MVPWRNEIMEGQNKLNILVIDAQGGGIGRMLVSSIKAEIADAFVMAVGTNSAATNAMLKAGADTAATGENPIRVCARRADVIVGPVGIVIADSMMGEITAAMALAVGRSTASRILLPLNSRYHCNNIIAGTKNLNTSELVQSAVEEIKKLRKMKSGSL